MKWAGTESRTGPPTRLAGVLPPLILGLQLPRVNTYPLLARDCNDPRISYYLLIVFITRQNGR
jgi:hypothetical protein